MILLREYTISCHPYPFWYSYSLIRHPFFVFPKLLVGRWIHLGNPDQDGLVWLPPVWSWSSYSKFIYSTTDPYLLEGFDLPPSSVDDPSLYEGFELIKKFCLVSLSESELAPLSTGFLAQIRVQFFVVLSYVVIAQDLALAEGVLDRFWLVKVVFCRGVLVDQGFGFEEFFFLGEITRD